MEGAHGQLGARLADGLRGDHAHGLADIDQVTAAQVPAVALATNAVAGLAGNGRTHHHMIDPVLVQDIDPALVQQDAGLDHRGAVPLDRVLGQHAPQHALAQWFDHIAAFNDRAHGQPFRGPAVFLGHHQVL